MPDDCFNGKTKLNVHPSITVIDQEIAEVEALMRRQADEAHPQLRAALEHLLNAGGKRIRPTLSLLTGKMLGAPPRPLIYLAAAAELLHTATLVHDDLIDGALLRRGNPTLNAQWSPAATVLTGDFIFARAAKLAAETDHLPLMKLFAQTLATIVNGELTQMFSGRDLISRENYYQRIYAKTASLIEMSTQAAAMVSPVGQDVVESMRRFGYHLGIAFQIVDDVLDFVGDQNEIGKPVGSDLMQGLITLPALYFIEMYPNSDYAHLLITGEYRGNTSVLQELIQAIRKSEGIERSLNEASKHIEMALQNLENKPAGEARTALEELALYTVRRRF